ncbi:hypothetical protein MRB53_025067 [Persea americana]|uniref:Uncharacterized protein n=1 Tax=Persea americana TaxID=3435 RepID=A0ACC2LE80_PERAE|nr:hypothetical protein MRB53_025067 [Persea americana]
MVLQKRLNYGFNGYQVPAIPQASRSARGRRSGKKAEDRQMCAFDLLATVAGELLLLKESNPCPSTVSPGRTWFVTTKNTIKQGQQHKSFKHDPCEQGSSDKSAFSTKVGSHMRGANYVLEDQSHAQDGATLPPDSIKTNYEALERVVYSEESIIENKKDASSHWNCHTERVSSGFEELPDGKMDDRIERHESVERKCHTERGSSNFVEIPGGKTEDQIQRQLEARHQRIGCQTHVTTPDISTSKNPMDLDIKPPALVSSDSSIKAPLCGDPISGGLFPRCQDGVKVVCRDDDENSSRCTQHCTVSLKAFRPPHVGDRRIRKMLASKFWKVSPTLPKNRELSSSELERKPAFCSKKSWYTRQRTQRCYPFKRRKFSERNSVSTSGRGINGDGANSPKMNSNREVIGAGATVHGVSRASTPVAIQESSWKTENSHVKLSIKSFRVPELIIEMPETATIGSLKRTVVEAVSSILGGGLQIGVLLQGKKVRDDDKTLLQTGIVCDDKLDTLGFMLEPNPAHTPSLCLEDHPHLLQPRDATQLPTRYPVVPSSDPVVPDVSPDPLLVNTGNCIESDHDSVPSPDISSEKSTLNSRALVAIPSISVEALAVVPLPRKSRRSELVQRRIRRPFSVSEVEALVQAVEKLGTGRWRDVKLCAFEDAKHRTYVDLKDKWKTLVHTARISPQQRRGEPVPQELLDRVLSAHGYWSQQQAIQHVKSHAEPCLLL